MKVVIQCAGSKGPQAPQFYASDGRAVAFVARPEEAGAQDGVIFARPDDISDDGRSWRELLWEYNQESPPNPLGLLPAYRLYSPRIYQDLSAHFGPNLLILSAGWGLIPASFLIPDYNITFSQEAPREARRYASDSYSDWALIEPDPDGPIVFLGGKAYQKLFDQLTSHCYGQRVVVYNSTRRPTLPGLVFKGFETRSKQNWHYKAGAALIAGDLTFAGAL